MGEHPGIYGYPAPRLKCLCHLPVEPTATKYSLVDHIQSYTHAPHTGSINALNSMGSREVMVSRYPIPISNREVLDRVYKPTDDAMVLINSATGSLTPALHIAQPA